MPKINLHYGLVIAAAALWATLGPLTRLLIDHHAAPPLSIPFVRTASAAAVLFAGLALFRRDLLAASPRALKVLIPLGVLGVGAFYVTLVKAVELAGVALAAVLLYTGPAWTAAAGALFLREPFTRRKAVALALSLAGAALAVQVFDLAFVRVSLAGILIGLGSGLGYAVFAALTKVAQGRTDSRTMLLYAFGIGALVLLPFQDQGLAAALQPGSWPLWLAMVAGPTLGAWTLFSIAVRHVPVSNATIVASVEPVIANGLALALFQEWLTPPQLIGGGLILLAVVILQTEHPRGPRAAPTAN